MAQLNIETFKGNVAGYLAKQLGVTPVLVKSGLIEFQGVAQADLDVALEQYDDTAAFSKHQMERLWVLVERRIAKELVSRDFTGVGDKPAPEQVLALAGTGDAEAVMLLAWFKSVYSAYDSLVAPPADLQAWVDALPQPSV